MKKILFILIFQALINPILAEMTSQRWCGVDVDTIIGNSKYPDVIGVPQGFPIILYNLGTECFIVQGGDWAMEGRLFYSDFGRTMYLCENGRINSGITEKNISDIKNSFCVRPPSPYGKNWSNNDYSQFNLTTLMDGDYSKYDQTWGFERIENENTDTCTYYMYQTYGTSTKYYLGAAYGECHNSSVGKGDGQLVFLDDDRSCWTTYDVRGVTTKYLLEKGEEVELQKLYQWRLISLEEFLRVLSDDKVGLNPSVSALIPDRDFTRNDINFFGTWKTDIIKDYPYEETDYRYPFTWGNYKMGSDVRSNKQTSRGLIKEPWDSPVLLKTVFDTDKSKKDAKKDAKFGFMQFEGVGTAYVEFQVPDPGWYEITSTGFCQGNDAYMFARVIKDSEIDIPESEFDSPEIDNPRYSRIDLNKLNVPYKKDSYDNCLTVGKYLTGSPEECKRKLWILVSEEDFEGGIKTIRIGVGKNTATKSNKYRDGFYDTDWICIDDFRAVYMGKSPAFFYEDQETLDYLDDINYPDLYSQYEYPKRNNPGWFGGSVSLHRKFSLGKWNTFSFPLTLTGEQVRKAFGNDCELLRLDGIGTISRNEHIIDFRTVNLKTIDNVILPGKLYLLKPTKPEILGESPRNKIEYYYDLGKLFFSIKQEDPDYEYQTLNLFEKFVETSVDSYLGKNDGVENVSYIQTINYLDFRVNREGKVLDKVRSVEKTYAPKGSYVMSKGDLYELSRDTPLKGFRGWITLEHSIFEDTKEIVGFSIDGIWDLEENITVIKEIKQSNPVYNGNFDPLGRSIEKFTKGINIIGGKKIIVR